MDNRTADALRIRALALQVAQSRARPAAPAAPHEPVRYAPVSSHEWARWVDGGAPWVSRGLR